MICNYLFVFVVYLVHHISNAQTNKSTDDLNCPIADNTLVFQYQLIQGEIKVPTEEEIGQGGNFSGMQPTRYDVKLSFQNGTHYSGAVNIWMKVVEKTKYVMVNMKPNSPNLSYRTITVSARLTNTTLEEICISQFIRIDDIETLVIELSRQLQVGTECVVTFSYFVSSSFDENTQTGAEGLRRSSKDSHSTLHCLFQQKLARSVFPCMDHPVLKAKFQLTIDYPVGYTVASNTETLGEPNELVGTNLLRQLFKETPIIPTYLFAFSVMQNYLDIGSDKYTKFGFLAPEDNASTLLWIIPKAKEAFDYLQSIFQFQLPVDKLDFLFVDNYSSNGMENFGLITLKRGRMEDSSSTEAQGTVFHEITHQWIGNTVTVRNWNELCLQESLTTYVTRLLLERFSGITVWQWARQNQKRYVFRTYGCLLGKCVQSSNDHINNCYGRGAFVFHMIAQMYGPKSVETFARNLVNDYPFGSAGLDEWDSILARSLANVSAVNGFLRRWFAEPGPLTLQIRLGDDSRVMISQELVDGLQSAKPTLLIVYESESAESRDVIFSEASCSIPLNGSSWLLVDPDSQTLTRKLYTSNLYLRIFAAERKDQYFHLTNERRKTAADEFCRHVFDNLLPLSDDDNRDNWISVLQMIQNIDGLPLNCICCITPQPLRSRDCLTIPYKCDGIRLIQMLNFSDSVLT